MATPGDQVCRRRTSAGTWPQLRHLGAVAGDDENLAARDAVEDLSPVVAKLANSDRIHVAIVSPVRQPTI